MTKPRGRLDDGKHDEHASRNQHFDTSPEVKIRPNSSETIPIDQTGFNTNPKGETDYGECNGHGFAKSMF